MTTLFKSAGESLRVTPLRSADGSPRVNHNTSAFAYFLTMRTYATWLHGDERGSVDPKHNKIGTPLIKQSHLFNHAMKSSINEAEFLLNDQQRQTVLHSIIATCHYNQWKLFAAHVRINHLHIVLQSSVSKEKTMQKIKCYATKDLKKYHAKLLQRKNFWTRHGSTKNIWAPESLFPALYYVVKGQGKPMAVYYDKKSYDPLDEQWYECYLDT